MALSTVSIDPDFAFVRTLVRERTAIVLEDSKQYLVNARLAPIAAKEGCADVGELISKLRKHSYGPLSQSVIDAMTTNETFFFRDKLPFDALKQLVVPALLPSRSASRTLNIWCAACSSGQEPYSVALSLLESFPELASWKIQILASDISHEMLERTRDASYSQLEVNRGLPAPFLLKYFDRDGLRWRLKPQVRSMVSVKEVNLISAWPAMPPVDIFFLRNVLIYFDVDTKKKILTKVRRVMAPDGFLFLGGAESTLGIHDDFERAPFANAGCYKLAGT